MAYNEIDSEHEELEITVSVGAHIMKCRGHHAGPTKFEARADTQYRMFGQYSGVRPDSDHSGSNFTSIDVRIIVTSYELCGDVPDTQILRLPRTSKVLVVTPYHFANYDYTTGILEGTFYIHSMHNSYEEACTSLAQEKIERSNNT